MRDDRRPNTLLQAPNDDLPRFIGGPRRRYSNLVKRDPQDRNYTIIGAFPGHEQPVKQATNHAGDADLCVARRRD
jgi:hypothetical protein